MIKEAQDVIYLQSTDYYRVQKEDLNSLDVWYLVDEEDVSTDHLHRHLEL